MGYAYQGSKEILHSTRVGGIDAFKSGTYTWHQWLDSPARQNCLPTEEYVEMFPWADGTPFDWKSDSIKGKVEGAKGQLFYKYEKVRGGFKKTASRDPRLYEECIVNGQMTSLDWTTGKSLMPETPLPATTRRAKRLSRPRRYPAAMPLATTRTNTT